MAVSRTSIRDKDLRMPVRWYRVNPAKKDADSVYKRGAGGGDARRGGWIRSMRRTVGMTEVPAARMPRGDLFFLWPGNQHR